MKRLVLALLLLASPAMAQDVPIETVTSRAGALLGLWKITWPPLPAKPGQAPFQTILDCRIEPSRDTPAVHCFDWRNGMLTVRDGKLRILWSTPTLQSNVVEATMTSPDTFAGSERVRMAGITMLRFEGLVGVRQPVDPQRPDLAGKAAQLARILEESAGGALKVPTEKTALLELPETELLHRLGPVRSTMYVARTPIWRDGAWVQDFFSLYLVEFQNGNRLCGLHQRDDGVLDAFRCV
jgi:hypothetical protein